jgi:hypothetical protein
MASMGERGWAILMVTRYSDSGRSRVAGETMRLGLMMRRP